MNLFSSSSSDNDTDSIAHDREQKSEHPFWEIVRFSLIALLIVIPVRMFVAQPFIVSGASMEETFQNGEYLIVDQLTYHFSLPQRGDVVVFRYPRDPSKFFIKRVIGVPGDTISITNNVVTITNTENPDGLTLNEPYVASLNWASNTTEVLGEREYFVMGDNRNFSSDSRAWGVLQEERIIGRAFVRLFPPQNFDYLPGSVKTEDTFINSP